MTGCAGGTGEHSQLRELAPWQHLAEQCPGPEGAGSPRLEALCRIGREVSQSLDLKAVSAVALDTALGVLGMDAGAMGYLDEATQELVALADQGLPTEMAQEIRNNPRPKPGQATLWKATLSSDYLIIEDVAHDPRTILQSVARSGFQFHIRVPLKHRGAVVGVLGAWSRHRQVFSGEEVRMVVGIGSIVGAAIANARLFGQVETAKQEWEACFDAMSDGVSIHSPDFRILRANKALAEMLGTTPQALIGLPCHRVMHGRDEPISGCPLLKCVEAKAAVTVEQRESHLGSRWLHITCDPRLGPSSEVQSVVHVVRDITLQKDQEATERRHSEEMELLFRVARIMVESGSFQEKSARALEELVRVAQADRVFLDVSDDPGKGVRVVATAGPGIARLPPAPWRPKGEGIAGLAFDEGQLVVANDYPNHPRALADVVAHGVKSAIALPIKTEDRVHGVIYADSLEAGHFFSDRIQLLAAVANGIGILLENARLQEADRLRAQEIEARSKHLAAINSIARAISSSLDMDEIYHALDHELGKILPFDRMSVAVLTQDRDVAEFLQPGEVLPAMPRRQRTDDSGVIEVLRTGQPLILHDMAVESRSPVGQQLVGMGLRSALVAPLVAKSTLLGTLNVFSQKVDCYSRADLELIQPIADHVALALDNARLHQEMGAELERDHRRLEVLQLAARQLALETSPRRALQRLVDLARDLVGASYGVLRYQAPGEQGNELVASGVPPEGQTPGPGQREDDSSPGSVVRVAVVSRGRTSGFLSLARNSGESGFTADDRRLLRLFAVLAGVHLENMGLYAEVTRERQTLAAIQSSMTEGLVVVGANGEIVYFNRAAAAITGWKTDEIQNRPAHELRAKALDILESPESLDILTNAMEGSGRGPVTVDLALKSPQQRALKVTAFPIEIGPGQRITGLLLQDTTEQRDLERRRNAFVSAASHELRTPMTAILGFSELLLHNQPSAATQRTWLGHIYQGSKRMAAIVDDLLNVSSIQSGKMRLNLETLQVPEIVDGALSLVRPMTDKHAFRAEIPPQVPLVVGDREKLLQVLVNLLHNAVRYSPDGGRITVSACHQPEQEQVVLSVADEGVGVDPMGQSRLFTPFFRIHRPETEGVRGTGLGLYIVKTFVELMGGKVWLESGVDKGSTFFFSVPVRKTD